MDEREELAALRRLAELEAKAGSPAWMGQSGESRAKNDNPSLDVGALVDTVKDVPRLAGQGAMQTLQGFMDLPVGAAQVLSKVVPGNGMEDAVGDYMRKREAAYASVTGKDERPDQIQPGRIAGNVISGIALTPDKTPAGLFGRMKQGAKVGAGMGLASPVDPDNSEFWGTKGVQTAVSAGAGFLAPAVIEGLIRGASSAANWLSGKAKGAAGAVTGATRPAEIESTLTLELQKNGVDFGQLSKEMRDQLVGEVQTALKAGGSIDDAAVKRLADFTKVGVKPTQGQISRDPYQWGQERNLGKMEVGKPIADRLGEQNNRMIGVIDEVRGTLSPAPDQYAAGEGAINTLKTVGASQKAGVDAAYKAARAEAGIESDVPLQPVAQRIGQVIEDFGDDKIPGAVRKRLSEFGLFDGKQTRVFNLREAEKLKTLLDNNVDGYGTPMSKALGEIKRSVDDAINSLGDDAGNAAAGAFRQARSAASERFGNLERTPALADVMDKSKQLSPERFVEQYFVRGDVNSVKSVMGQMPAQGRAEVQAGVMDWIRSKAVLGEGDTATLSAAGLKKALDTIGDRKLADIFQGNEEILSQLMTLKRVAAYVDRAPKSTSANFSGSGTMIADTLDKVGKLPVVGALMGKPGDFIRATQVARAVGSPAPVKDAAPLIQGEFVDRFAPRAGLLAAPVVGAVPSAFFQSNRKVNRNDERRN